jgi:hypothetical protein
MDCIACRRGIANPDGEQPGRYGEPAGAPAGRIADSTTQWTGFECAGIECL